MRKIPILIIAAMAGAACSRHADDYSRFHDIPDRRWGFYHHLIFDMTPEDSVVTGELQLVVRHTNDYPFSNLYLEMTCRQPGGATSCDTLSVELADIYGNWLGSGLGTSFQRAVTVNPHFTVCDSAHIRLRHVMRVDPVPEIEQIGIIFKAIDPK
ncbi:MAG: gliding motility lipoprotein GldH [Muribaculaceae bacterium]|nr:gliding motility lipoprotein GldH [Muribaculaceae bacterium]